MENTETIIKNDVPFDPDKAFDRIVELHRQYKNIDYSNKEEYNKQFKEINKEVKLLIKLRKEYYSEKIVELKKKRINAE